MGKLNCNKIIDQFNLAVKLVPAAVALAIRHVQEIKLQRVSLFLFFLWLYILYNYPKLLVSTRTTHSRPAATPYTSRRVEEDRKIGKDKAKFGNTAVFSTVDHLGGISWPSWQWLEPRSRPQCVFSSLSITEPWVSMHANDSSVLCCDSRVSHFLPTSYLSQLVFHLFKFIIRL